MSPTLLFVPASFALGALLWTLAEYLLHRFAMHALKGKGMMSREHLEHHVHSSWQFTASHLLSWTAMLLVGAVVWIPIGWLAVGPLAGVALGLGWAAGYFFYEYQHAMAHRRAPAGRYSAWIRRHHFHHHFGHPMARHGVSIDLWDRVFGTLDVPTAVRVPRRLALPWLIDDSGELRAEFAGQYVLVGAAGSARQSMIDRARAFASVAPADGVELGPAFDLGQDLR
jgi:sterol desaturase/sphingolipid hydroxylase (fatty acid hydroxylase superfamily)